MRTSHVSPSAKATPSTISQRGAVEARARGVLRPSACVPSEVIWLGHIIHRRIRRLAPRAAVAPPLAVALAWLFSHAWNWAGGTTWTVERISECPSPHSRLQTTG